MTNKEKFEIIRNITVQDVIEWLDGCLVSYVVTEWNLDHIDSQFCSRKVHQTLFSKGRYGKVYLSNQNWLDNGKSFLSEFDKKKNQYWKGLSRNSIKKCEDRDDMVRMILRAFRQYLHFKTEGRNWDFINIKSVISKDGCSMYVHDKSGEIQTVRDKIREIDMEMEKLNWKRGMLKNKLWKLERYQEIHEEVFRVG